MSKQTKVTVSTDALASKIEELKGLDSQLVALKGTAGEWLRKGTEAARGFTLLGNSTVTLTAVTLGEMLDALESKLAEAQQFGNEVAGQWVKANRTDSDATAALKSRRETLAAEAEAMRSVFVQLVGEDAVSELTIPSAPKGRASSGASTVSKGVQFYRIVNGEEVYPSPSQNSLSSIAFYKFGRCGADALRSALEVQHGQIEGGTSTRPIDETKDFGPAEVTVVVGGETFTHTIGWHILACDADAPEAKGPGDTK